MGEILEFKREDKTAIGRFLLAADQQAEPETLEKALMAASEKPSPEKIEQAKRELDLIFSGDNAEDADALYRQGLDDVVHRRGPSEMVANPKVEAAKLMLSQMFGLDLSPTAEELGYTPSAVFYVHVSRLQEIANHAFDSLPQ